MKTTLLLSSSALASFAAGALYLPNASSQSGATFATRDYGINLLGNPGFEAWGYGVADSIPPELWRIDGEPANTFAGTGSLITRRVPGQSDCTRDVAGGEWAVELIPVDPDSFLSQELENPREFRCKTLTFSARFKSTNVTSPTITIDDGVSSTSDTRVLVAGEWRTLSVTHKVSADATQVEMRIDPGSATAVDDAQLVLGDQPLALYTPRANPEPALMELPLGAVIDWYRVDANVPVPEGYAICDGGVVADPTSAYVRLAMPDLSERFVRGVTDPVQIGTTGGSDTVGLTHTHVGTTGSNQSPGTDYWFMSEAQFDTLHNAKDGHTHTFTTNSALGNVSIVPRYFGLLKIMRVR